MARKSIFKFVAIFLIIGLCMNLYRPVIYAQDAGNDKVDKLSMKLDLKGFSTYQNNNYIFEFGEDTGYASAGDIWLACITKGFSFKLDKALTNLSALGIVMGYTTSSSGSFTIGEDTYALTLNYKGGEADADWTFEEVTPNINYYERFINTDPQGNVSTVLINDIHADYYQGTNFKQVFLKGMREKDGASVKSRLLSSTDNVSTYGLTATIAEESYEYIARVTTNCSHSSVKSYACDHVTHVKEYIVDYLKEHDLDQSTYADYCVDMCDDCGKLMSVHRINDSIDPPGESGENGEAGENDLPSVSGNGELTGDDEPDDPPSVSGNGELTGDDEPDDPPSVSENGELTGGKNTDCLPEETHKDGVVSNESRNRDVQVSPAVSKPYLKFSKKSYRIKKGKKIKIKFKSSAIDYKKLKVKVSRKGCIRIKKISKSYILIEANKRAGVTITLKYKTQKAKAHIRIT